MNARRGTMRESTIEVFGYLVTILLLVVMGSFLTELFTTPVTGNDDIAVYQRLARNLDGGR